MNTSAKVAATTLGAVILLLLIAVLGVALFPKQIVEFALERKIGREVNLAGEFEVDWGRTLRIHATDVSVANAAWAKEPALFKAQTLDIAIKLAALTQGEIILPVVHIAGAELNLARSAAGENNWTLSEHSQANAAPTIPVIAALRIDNSRVGYRDLGTGNKTTGSIDALQGAITSAAVRLQGRGKLEQNPLSFDFVADGTAALAEPDPYQFKLGVASGTNSLQLAGTLADPLNMNGLQVQATLEGKQLQELAALVGVALPVAEAYRMVGSIRQQAQSWHLTGLDIDIGESELNGDVTLDFSDARPMLNADLVSNQLDADLLRALNHSVSASSNNDAAKGESEVTQRSPAPTYLSQLQKFDADVEVVVHEIVSTKFPIDEVAVKLTLEQGLLVVDPLKVELADGRFLAEMRLDVSGAQPSGKINLSFEHLALAPFAALAPFVPLAPRNYALHGTIDGELTLAFAGDSIRIADGKVNYRAPKHNTDMTLTLSRIADEPKDLLKIATQGTLRGVPAQASLVGAPLSVLLAEQASYPISIEAHLAKTDISAQGTMTEFGRRFDLKASASGPGTARLSRLLGVKLPPLPAFEASAQIERGANVIELSSLKAKVGKSDVSGSVRVNTQNREPYIKADLKSQTLAYADFELWHLQNKSDQPLDLARLAKFDADVHLAAKRVIAPDQVIFSNVVVDAEVEDGRLRLNPLKFGVAGGQVLANMLVAEVENQLIGHLDANIDSVDLGVALRPVGLAKRFAGTLDADIDLALSQASAAKGKSKIRYREKTKKTDVKLVIDQTVNALEINGSGSFHGKSFQLDASLGELSKLLSNDPFPVDINIAAVDTQASIQGTVGNPLQLKDLGLTLKIAGPSPARLSPILGLSLPALPPYEIVGALSRNEEIWRFENFKGEVGDSLLSGNIKVDTAGDKPFLRAQLESKHLDLDDLAPLIGQAPDPLETASPRQIANAELSDKDERTLPDKPFKFDRLKAMNAQVHFHAASISSDVVPLDELTFDLTLIDGLMTLKPIVLGGAGGTLRMTAVLDAGFEPAQGQLEAELTSIDLAKLLQPFDIAQGTRGVIAGQAKLSFQGTTFAQMLGVLDGDVKLLMRDGQISSLLVELAGIDGGESLLTWLEDGVQTFPVRCAFADLEAQDGIVSAERFVLDSTDTKFNLHGEVSLKQESLDLIIKAHPKDVSFLSARAPLIIEGTFNNPKFRVSRTGLIARGLAAIGLAIIAPPAALLALVEPGLGDNAQCAGLMLMP